MILVKDKEQYRLNKFMKDLKQEFIGELVCGFHEPK